MKLQILVFLFTLKVWETIARMNDDNDICDFLHWETQLQVGLSIDRKIEEDNNLSFQISANETFIPFS